ncbi:YggT family protein [Chitinispirillales bacterium ANBcel5]|uniref:YggT family protein n=1 Tax=Cellulosispirillum alkaliphilum TaxID=3039283 RepID=UPI002A5768A5|nr:YggT family protein [Chitinispirillales bacterium ANBcel5]
MIPIIFALFRVYQFLILIRVILSWVHPYRDHILIEWVYRLTEPLLEPIRRLLPVSRLGLDISPLILLLILQFIQRILLRL